MARAKSTYATVLSNQVTPQTQPIPGRESEMKRNNAGGVTFTITPFEQLERFLILGSDKPTYYASAQKLSKDNAENIRKCLATDGRRTVDTIVEVSDSGRAPKNDPAIFALAVAATPAYGSAETAQYALDRLGKVCRTGTHLLQFCEIIDGMRGWGRSLKNAVARWYTEKDADQLAYQLVKYQQRGGESSKGLLRLSHPKVADERQSAVMAWSVAGGLDALATQATSWTPFASTKYTTSADEIAQRRARYQNAHNILSGDQAPKYIAGYEAAKKATSAKEVARIIRETGITHEMIPTQFKTDADVWEALLEKMPLTAMIRNLGVMSKVGLLAPLSNASKVVTTRLNDQQYIRKSRVHPMTILLAQGTYRQGHGRLGNSTWTVVPTVVDALEDAFYQAFSNVVPTGKNIYIAQDVSGSMSSEFTPGSGISCAQAGAAMAMVLARTEKNYCVYGFASNGGYGGNAKMVDLGVTAKDTLSSACKKVQMNNFGGTDCALPMIHAEQQKMDVDAFIVITDNETWAGKIHPQKALTSYRAARNKPDAKEVVMGMTASPFTIADPKDPRTLDVVGFDANVPAIITDFIRGAGANSTSVEDDE